MSTYYMLDTNMASFIIKDANSVVKEHLLKIPMSKICISAITEAELLFGLAKRPGAIKLKTAVQEFLMRIEVMPWDSEAANSYARFRNILEKNGNSLGAMDMLIAAHFLVFNAILVTNDQAFDKVEQFLVLAD